MKPIVVHNWGQFIEKIAVCMQAQDNVGLWWRGLANSTWDLVPRVYRPSYHNSEQTTYNEFINKGKTRHSPTPASNDFVAWLLLMQHYGLCTRLLDWTKSPLIALYFAIAGIERDSKLSVAVWGLHPGKLNRHQGVGEGDSALLARAPVVIPILKEAFEYTKNPQSQKILAIKVEEFDVRHMVQMSAFTIHGISTPLNHLGGSDQFLAKIEIPAENVETFKQGLEMFGIDKSMLFPDLEHLADELNHNTFTK
ncbi:MAG: FRG domain-containing protein [Chloroflexi bacterium]|nr:FRG domain-containing protein [Chloroflexota bacterium]MBI3930639.1 FRG domain-containing protein [Chloroflexota bacterium]